MTLLSLVSRCLNAASGGSFDDTLCRRSLRADAPGWLRLLGAAVEWVHPGHLAWVAGES